VTWDGTESGAPRDPGARGEGGRVAKGAPSETRGRGLDRTGRGLAWTRGKDDRRCVCVWYGVGEWSRVTKLHRGAT
jgi:hypothetical protein